MSANAMFYRYPSSTTYNFIYARRKRLRLWKILVLVSVFVPDLNLSTVTRQSEISDTGVPEFAIQFEARLKSADGGNLDQQTSWQHRKQISKLLKVIDLKHDMASLFNPIIINDKFLEGHAKGKYQPKTTKSYLMSLRHFYSFALNNDCGVSISKEHIVSVKRK